MRMLSSGCILYAKAYAVHVGPQCNTLGLKGPSLLIGMMSTWHNSFEYICILYGVGVAGACSWLGRLRVLSHGHQHEHQNCNVDS